MSLIEYSCLLSRARDVVMNGRAVWEAQTPLEKLTIALILNEPMWIMEMGCSMAQAIDTIGVERCSVLLAIEQELSREVTSNCSSLPDDCVG